MSPARESRTNPEDQVIVQDIQRELLLAELLRLRHMPGRWGHDAEDEGGNRYELKTTTKSGFGTARDVSPRMIAEWRKRYWVCAKGRNLRSGFVFDEVYFLSPQMLDDWFRSLEARFQPDVKLRDLAVERLRELIRPPELARVEYLFNRGMTYNNPHIGMAYVRTHGALVDLHDASASLRGLVDKNPITQ